MKRLFSIRFLVTVLCLVLALAVFASCDSGSSGGGETTAGNGETSGNGETTGGGDTNGGDDSQGGESGNGTEDGDGTESGDAPEVGGDFSLLDENNNVRYTIIYSQDVDTTTNDGRVNDGIDYVVSYFTETWTTLEEALDVTIRLSIDTGRAKDENMEILLGRTNRPETEIFLQTLKPNEYGYGVVGNKLVIAGWSDLTIGEAVTKFLLEYEQYIVENESGVKNLVIPENTAQIAAHTQWNVDIPMYNGGDLNGVVELINNAYEMYYIDTTPEEFMTYRSELETAGYELHQENQIGDNLYATYSNSKTMIHTYYMAYNNTVRVITESRRTAVLPQNEDPNMGEKITDTTFTIYDSDEDVGNWGNCFIITLEDGSFILHDGGANYKHNNQQHEREELYNLLNKLNKREDGQIVIAAWIISHQHFDHFANAYDVIREYYSENITLEKIIFNVAAPTVYFNGNNPNYYYENGQIDEILTKTSAEQVVMHTGQTIQIRNLKLEVIYTTEDLYPEKIETFNNSTLVHRFKVGEGENEQTVTITGDIQDVASELMEVMYGDLLKTDILQVAHHGGGGTIDLYAFFKPTIVFWPHSQKNYDSHMSGTGYYPGINQSLINQQNVKLVIIADDGHKEFPLPLLGITNNEKANEDLVTVHDREDGRP